MAFSRAASTTSRGMRTCRVSSPPASAIAPETFRAQLSSDTITTAEVPGSSVSVASSRSSSLIRACPCTSSTANPCSSSPSETSTTRTSPSSDLDTNTRSSTVTKPLATTSCTEATTAGSARSLGNDNTSNSTGPIAMKPPERHADNPTDGRVFPQSCPKYPHPADRAAAGRSRSVLPQLRPPARLQVSAHAASRSLRGHSALSWCGCGLRAGGSRSLRSESGRGQTRRCRCRGAQRLAEEPGVDAVDEGAAPWRQVGRVIGLQSSFGDQYAEVGAFEQVVAGAVDPEEEELALVLQPVPVPRRAPEGQRTVLLELPLPGARRGRDEFHGTRWLLEDDLAPHVDRGEFAPAFVDLVRVDVVVDVQVFEQVEQE